MKKLFIILLCTTSILSCSKAQNKDDYNAAKNTFKKMYPNVNKSKWNEDDHGYYEANFKLNGQKLRADFNPSGTWVETEQSIDWSDLPDAIQKVIKSSYDKDDITEIELVDHFSKGQFYDVEFKRKGKNKDIEFDLYGRIIN